MSIEAFGIDFGGTFIKGAPVDLTEGDLTAERMIEMTPKESTPAAVARVLNKLVHGFSVQDGAAVGVAIPATVECGILGTAAHIDRSWIGLNAETFLTRSINREVRVVNDADAAGLAESRYGAAAGRSGLVIVTTLGTGIGSALIYNGVLVPNSELGHVELGGVVAEARAANSARTRGHLSWQQWAKRLTDYYRLLEKLFSPDLFIVGGGVSAVSEKFLPLIDVDTEIVTARLQNRAGIVGAALYAAQAAQPS
jgi:polyphosphate glucokinase